jgi:hypothetical protein
MLLSDEACCGAAALQSIMDSNKTREKPVVAWVSHSSYEGDEGIFSLTPYKVQLIEVRAFWGLDGVYNKGVLPLTPYRVQLIKVRAFWGLEGVVMKGYFLWRHARSYS